MPSPLDDIITPRLILRLMDHPTISACLDGDLEKAGLLLHATIPQEMLEHLSGLRYGEVQSKADPGYQPWSARAIIIPDENVMVGLIRFHSSPNPKYLQPYVTDAVELGYRIFAHYRRMGLATEAIRGMMNWARLNFNVHRFVASVSPLNEASLKLLEHFDPVKIGEAFDEVDGMENIYLLG